MSQLSVMFMYMYMKNRYGTFNNRWKLPINHKLGCFTHILFCKTWHRIIILLFHFRRCTKTKSSLKFTKKLKFCVFLFDLNCELLRLQNVWLTPPHPEYGHWKSIMDELKVDTLLRCQNLINLFELESNLFFTKPYYYLSGLL